MIVLFAFAILLRFAYGLLYPRLIPYADYPVADAAIYLRWADAIAAGDWIGQSEGVFYRAPLYPYLLALRVGSGWMSWTLLQMALGLATIFFVYRIATRSSGTRAGFFAVALLVFYGPLLAFETKALPTTLALFLHTLFLWTAIETVQGQRRGRAFASGLLLGLGILMRPTWIALLALVPLVLGKFVERRRRLALSLFFAIGVALVVFPVTLRNRVVGGEWVLVSSNGGITFFQGNNEENRSGLLAISSRLGLTGSAEDQRAIELSSAERWTGRPLSPGESSRFWFGEGVRFAAEQPLAWARLELWKAYRFALSFEYADNYSFGRERARVVPLAIAFLPFGVLLGLGLSGWIFARKEIWSNAAGRLVTVSALLAVGGSLAFYVSSRYRIEIVPALAVLGGVGIVSFLSASHVRRASAAGLAILVSAASFLSPGAPARSQESMAAAQLGELYERAGDPGGAQRAYAEAVELFPANVLAWERAVRLAAEERGVAAADSVLQRVPAALRAEPQLLFASGVLAETRGDLGAAEGAYRAALRNAANPPQIEARLGVVLAQQGNRAEALSLLESSFAAGDRRASTAAYLAVLRTLDGDEAGSAAVRAELPPDLAGALEKWETAIRDADVRRGADGDTREATSTDGASSSAPRTADAVRELGRLRPDLARAIALLTAETSR